MRYDPDHGRTLAGFSRGKDGPAETQSHGTEGRTAGQRCKSGNSIHAHTAGRSPVTRAPCTPHTQNRSIYQDLGQWG